ncbi:MAG: hypothetical protein E4H00_03210 [Myxococcales bacterium]|nr:MAG: hypothetical protein E4H00_03210 [Myxococcales bacterium]
MTNFAETPQRMNAGLLRTCGVDREALDHLTGELVSLADGLLLDHHRAGWLDLAGPALTDRR